MHIFLELGPITMLSPIPIYRALTLPFIANQKPSLQLLSDILQYQITNLISSDSWPNVGLVTLRVIIPFSVTHFREFIWSRQGYNLAQLYLAKIQAMALLAKFKKNCKCSIAPLGLGSRSTAHWVQTGSVTVV